jgi:hypothetical protein
LVPRRVPDAVEVRRDVVVRVAPAQELLESIDGRAVRDRLEALEHAGKEVHHVTVAVDDGMTEVATNRRRR